MIIGGGGVMLLRMQARDFLIDPAHLLQGADGLSDYRAPLGFVDLRACPPDLRIAGMPPFPLIGLGDPAHPAAGALDAIVEAPVSAETLIRQVARTPNAAAVTVQLLRNLEGLPIERALQLESICYGLLQGSAEYQA